MTSLDKTITVRRLRPLAAVLALAFAGFTLVTVASGGSWTMYRWILLGCNVFGLWVQSRAALMSVSVEDSQVVVRNQWRTWRIPIGEVERFEHDIAEEHPRATHNPVVLRTDGRKVRLEGLVSLLLPNPPWIEQSIDKLNSVVGARR